MKIRFIFTLLAGLWVAANTEGASRREIALTDGWGIKPITSTVVDAPLTPVTVPHTWNAEYPDSSLLYNREMMVYQRTLEVTADMAGKRLFLYFEGINSAADVFVNGRTVGAHKGGYTACSFEITRVVRPGENRLEVWVSNAFRTDILPISGDFNVYGGIHRPCRLIVTEPDCISPVFYASPGVFIHQNNVSESAADILVETVLSLTSPVDGLSLRTTVQDADGRQVARSEAAVRRERMHQPMLVPSPVLWNGKKNPYLYTVTVELLRNGTVIDRIDQRTGFRYFSVDPDKGFFLNGEYLDLYGFNRHEDVKGRGSALTPEDYARDMALIDEIGATAMRLAHYPHAEPMYDLADEHGIVLWTEIPLVGPGGYGYTGFVNSVRDNARQVLNELVYQKFNHPSICFWGIFNEVLVDDGVRFKEYDDPVPFFHELNGLYKSLDPSRLTTFATCVDQSYYLGCADLVAWNKYFGWGSARESYGRFFDGVRAASNGQPVGVSEYGTGGSVLQHASELRQTARFHPEEVQNRLHEGAWEAFAERQYLWGKFIWLFADFQSFIRREGDTDGINDKGLLTYDRGVKKDAFFFYKANWNPDPMIYLTNRRFTERDQPTTEVKVYTNLSEATLYVNGRRIGTARKDALNRVVWTDVVLVDGANEIRVEGRSGRETMSDSCTWNLTR